MIHLSPSLIFHHTRKERFCWGI